MDREIEDPTPGEEWRESLSATCNRLSTQYLNLLRSASSVTALDGVAAAVGSSVPSASSTSALSSSSSSAVPSSMTRADPRSGGGGQKMTSLQDPPPPPLAADVAAGSLQCQLAAENLCVAASHLLSLIRTLRLSILLMDEETIEAEEEWQVLQVQDVTQQARAQADQLELEWMELRNQNP